MIPYRCQAMPFRVGPLTGKICGYDLDEFSGFLDVLFTLADYQNGLNARFIRPVNVFATEEDSNIVLGLNYSKAIPEECGIHEMHGGTKQMEFFAKIVMGMKIECIFKIPKDVIKNYLESFNELRVQLPKLKYQEVNEKLRKLSDNEELRKISDRMNKAVVDSESGDYMFVNPIFHSRDISIDPDLCFLVMPFNDKRKELLEKVVKPKIEEKFKLNVLKSGDIQGANQNIMENIWTYINQASFIIADMSDGNPNVFYELGICHTLGKPVILLCDEDSRENDYDGKLPFDLSGLQVIFYSNSGYGPLKLTDDIIEAITNMRKKN